MSKKWYAVYTKNRCEKKVSDLLTQKQIENYYPLNRIENQWSDRKKSISEPLFTSYIFVRISENMLSTVRDTYGVLNFVYWLSKPAVIKDDEILAIKEFLNEHGTVKLEKCDVKIHDTVRITDGAFLFKEGNVIEVKNNAVKVILPSLGYTLVAEIKRIHIEPARKSVFKSDVQMSK